MKPSKPPHGPENAEHEIRKAYSSIIDAAACYFKNQQIAPAITLNEGMLLYRRAYNCYRKEQRLAAERWARTVKHLARAFLHEAKIAYLEPRSSELPYLEGAEGEEYGLYNRSDTTQDLLDSVCNHIPPGLTEMPREMENYLARAREHLEVIKNSDYKHELLRAIRVQAAHEYGRVLECMALAYEAESAAHKKVA